MLTRRLLVRLAGMVDVHAAPLREIDPVLLYALLKLRVDVFVVEQECPYPELDGRDVEPGALIVWATDGNTVAGTLRLLTEPDGSARIGRVATAADHRGSGVAAALIKAAIEVAGPREIKLHAQSHLHRWYERFDFVQSGAEYLEDGIPHIPMRRSMNRLDSRAWSTTRT
jgi:ElaA protein